MGRCFSYGAKVLPSDLLIATTSSTISNEVGSICRGKHHLCSRNQRVLIQKVSATLAAGVLVKALSERPNFYSAAVYLAQSSANLMVSSASSSSDNILGHTETDPPILDPDKLHLSLCLRCSTWPPKTAVRTTSPNRNRAALRKSLVICDRDMPFDDYIQRIFRRLVHGHVLQLTCW